MVVKVIHCSCVNFNLFIVFKKFDNNRKSWFDINNSMNIPNKWYDITNLNHILIKLHTLYPPYSIHWSFLLCFGVGQGHRLNPALLIKQVCFHGDQWRGNGMKRRIRKNGHHHEALTHCGPYTMDNISADVIFEYISEWKFMIQISLKFCSQMFN